MFVFHQHMPLVVDNKYQATLHAACIYYVLHPITIQRYFDQIKWNKYVDVKSKEINTNKHKFRLQKNPQLFGKFEKIDTYLQYTFW